MVFLMVVYHGKEEFIILFRHSMLSYFIDDAVESMYIKLKQRITMLPLFL